METIIYMRMSEDDTKEEIEKQKVQLLEYITTNKIKKYILIEDGGYSGTNLNRPGLQRLVRKIKKEKVQKVVFTRIDRLSRNTKDYNNFIDLCKYYEVEVICLKQKIDYTATGILMQEFTVSLAEFESNQISERVKSSYIASLKLGKYPFGGKPPFGISKSKYKKLYYNKNIEIVKDIFELFNEGHSYEDIKREIEIKYSITMYDAQVARILRNTLYQGYREYDNNKYYFLEPIVKSEIKVVDGYKRRNICKHAYIFSEYLTKDFNQTTARKVLRTTGEVKEYKYYIHKKDKFKISEDNLYNQILKTIGIENDKINKEIKIREKRIKKLYVMGNINRSEYEEMVIENLKDKKVGLDMNLLEELEIKSLNTIRIKYEGKETLLNI